MHSFTTERLLIRPLSNQDKELYISLYCDAKVMRNIGEAMSHDKAEKAFNNTLKIMKKFQPQIMTWAIVDLTQSKTIGIQGFTWPTTNSPSVDKERAIAEIGIMLLRISNGRLMPEEAIGSLIEYGFSHLPLNQIDACFTHKNLATARVAKKAGFIVNETQHDNINQQRVESVFKNTWHGKFIKDINENNIV
jgi:RimJ/RimL family protein N-acetyltransferase